MKLFVEWRKFEFTLNKSYTLFFLRQLHMSHLMRLWHVSSSINSFFKRAHARLSSGARYLTFCLTLRPLPYFMCANSKSSGDTARMLVAYVISTIISLASSILSLFRLYSIIFMSIYLDLQHFNLNCKTKSSETYKMDRRVVQHPYTFLLKMNKYALIHSLLSSKVWDCRSKTSTCKQLQSMNGSLHQVWTNFLLSSVQSVDKLESESLISLKCNSFIF